MLAYFVQRRDDQRAVQTGRRRRPLVLRRHSHQRRERLLQRLFLQGGRDLAEMEAAAGRAEQAREYRELAQSIKTAFNDVLWKEDAPGGPRYVDWIDAEGNESATSATSASGRRSPWASPRPSRPARSSPPPTRRIAELEKEYGYQGYAGLSALWPVPESVNPLCQQWQTYGAYMNGGSLLCQTYWEIVARARAGDAEGASRRLKTVRPAGRGDAVGPATTRSRSRRAQRGRRALPGRHGGRHRRGGPRRVGHHAHLGATGGDTPSAGGWSRAEAEILYKGRRHRVTIEGGKVRIQPLEQVD